MVEDYNWRVEAACRGMNPAIFHPEKQKPDYQRNLNLAHATCKKCDVKEICREEAINDPAQIGVAGGTTVRTRKEIRTERRIKAMQRTSR